MNLKNIYLIVGPSGSGKTTLAEVLSKEYDFKTVSSYTTRPERYPGEKGHLFITDAEFDALKDKCAFTTYNGYRYCVTSDIIDNSDLYVIDPYGVKVLQNVYHGKRGIKMIRLLTDEVTLKRRMAHRGDSDEKIAERLNFDKTQFMDDGHELPYDLILPVANIYDMTTCVVNFIACCEGKHIYMQI